MKKEIKKHLPAMVVNLMVVEVLLVVVGTEGSEIYPLTTAACETWTSKGSHWLQAIVARRQRAV